MKRKGVVLNNAEGRDFEQFELPTKHLVLAVLSRPQPGTDEHILHLAGNLRRSEFIINRAHRLLNSEPLVVNWQEIAWLISVDCLKQYHKPTFDHLLKTRQMMIEQLKFLRKHRPRNIDDMGIEQFRTMKHFRLTDAEEDNMIWAASYCDLCNMAYPTGYWDQSKSYDENDRRELDYHARLFFNLGEFCNIPEDVVAMSVLHHYPSLRYPQNGIISKFSHFLADNRFRYMLDMLVVDNMYAAGTSVRPWREKPWTHHEAVSKWLPEVLKHTELLGFLPLIEAIRDLIPHQPRQAIQVAF